MMYIAHIDVMPKEELLDPQGKAVLKNLHKIGAEHVENLRIGKHIRMEFEALNEEEAIKAVENACQKLLINPIMEYFSFRLEKV